MGLDLAHKIVQNHESVCLFCRERHTLLDLDDAVCVALTTPHCSGKIPVPR